MPFTTRLAIEEQDAFQWRLIQPLIYEGEFDTFTVPAGTWTDLASIPRILWIVLPPIGAHNKAAVLHDRLYRTQPVSRKDADGIFRRILKESYVGFKARWAMYLGVRLFGWLAWRENADRLAHAHGP